MERNRHPEDHRDRIRRKNGPNPFVIPSRLPGVARSPGKIAAVDHNAAVDGSPRSGPPRSKS